MNKFSVSTAVAGALLALASQAAVAAPDWGKVPKRDINVFHAGVTPIEWATKKSDHSGSAGMRKGESCAGCHEEKGTLNFNFKRLADKELEPKGAPKTMMFPVSVQAGLRCGQPLHPPYLQGAVRRCRQGRQGQRGQGHAAVRRRQGAAGRPVRLLAELPRRRPHHARRRRQEDQVHQGRRL
jgi:hypothetical protein